MVQTSPPTEPLGFKGAKPLVGGGGRMAPAKTNQRKPPAGTGAYPQRLTVTTAFMPPNPKAFTIAQFTAASRAVFGT